MNVYRAYFFSSSDKPIITVPFHLRQFRLNDLVTITCQVCSLPSTTIFDLFRPKKNVPIMQGVIEKYDENINQTCRRLVIKIFVRGRKKTSFQCQFIYRIILVE